MQNDCRRRKLPYENPIALIKTWPSENPLLFLGGESRFAVLAISAVEVDFECFTKKKLGTCFAKQADQQIPFTCGYLGLISYDDYCHETQQEASKSRPRVFRVNKSLVFDQDKKQAFLYEADIREHLDDKAVADPFDATAWLLAKQPKKGSKKVARSVQKPIDLIPTESEARYLARVEHAIEEIRAGRYYQINLLRYFAIPKSPSQNELLDRFENMSGPFGAVFALFDFNIVSFSPERFVKIERKAANIEISAYPIKGTIARHKDRERDRVAQKTLRESGKDQRELNIIVDLMRNDLNRVALPSSERVEYNGQLRSFKTVHHLVAKVSAHLDPTSTLQKLFEALCPGASITGAPKIEVMKAIRASENRPRGYFMGHCFFLDDSGRFDSSVLIRTMQGFRLPENEPHSPQIKYEYAAGSGIVLSSIASEELEETKSKCRVVADA